MPPSRSERIPARVRNLVWKGGLGQYFGAYNVSAVYVFRGLTNTDGDYAVTLPAEEPWSAGYFLQCKYRDDPTYPITELHLPPRIITQSTTTIEVECRKMKAITISGSNALDDTLDPGGEVIVEFFVYFIIDSPPTWTNEA